MNKFILQVSLLLSSMGIVWQSSDFTINRIEKGFDPVVLKELQQFESEFVYPFNENEEFRIKHGLYGNYFAFFEKLGFPYFYTAHSKNNKIITKNIDGQNVRVHQKAGEIAAAVCCVLRNMPMRNGKMLRAWYICDLKVNQKYQGEHLLTLMTKKISFWRYLQCPRGFAICMNPADGDPKAASIFKKHGPYENIITQTLNLYTFSLGQLGGYKNLLENILKKHGYMKSNQVLIARSTHGAKDYEIFNTIDQTKRSWNILHLQAGDAGGHIQLQEDATYMICSVEGSGLDSDFKKVLGNPSSTAQILSCGMQEVDFNCLTSDQI